jgi:hypothetical protein
MKQILSILCHFIFLMATGQKVRNVKSEEVSFYYTPHSSFDSTFAVVFSNNTDDTLLVYNFVDLGVFNDRFCNGVLKFERELGDGNFKEMKVFSYNSSMWEAIHPEQSFDLPRHGLLPNTIDTLFLKDYRFFSFLKPQETYRFKVYFRIEFRYDKRNKIEEILYKESPWFYIRSKEPKISKAE